MQGTGFSGSNPIQPEAPRLCGFPRGDRPSVDGHLLLLWLGRSYADPATGEWALVGRPLRT